MAQRAGHLLPNRAREEAAPDNRSFFVTFNRAATESSEREGFRIYPLIAKLI